MSKGMIRIEVAFALPTRQSIVEVMLREGATVDSAIDASNIAELYPDSDIANAKVGVWSRTAKRSDVLKDGDRVEIYRPLIADPKEVRKRRAEKAKEEGRADKVTGGRPNRVSPPTKQ